MKSLAQPSPQGTDTHSDDTFSTTLAIVADQMAVPPFNTPAEKLVKAVALVRDGKVHQQAEDVYTVEGTSKTYTCNATCDCPQGQMGKTKWCYHLVATEVARRVQQRLAPTWVEQAQAHPVLTTHGHTEAPAHNIPTHYLTEIHGQQYVKLEGLLHLAQARGLESLTVSLVQASHDLAICEATCDLDGKHFSDIGDATPGNVHASVSKHFIRCAATRAKARVLRTALGIGMCSAEEVEG